MTVHVNGEAQEVADGITVEGLLRQLELAQRKVAVAVNRTIVPRSEHPERRLEGGDRIEIVHAVQGG